MSIAQTRPAPSTTPVRPNHHNCKTSSVTNRDGVCGLDVPAAPTDDDVAEEEEEEVRINDEQSAEVGENLAAEEEVVRIASDPGQPSDQQVEEHRTRGHIPYRSWCRWCNLGRGRGQPHRERSESATEMTSRLQRFRRFS